MKKLLEKLYLTVFLKLAEYADRVSGFSYSVEKYDKYPGEVFFKSNETIWSELSENNSWEKLYVNKNKWLYYDYLNSNFTVTAELLEFLGLEAEELDIEQGGLPLELENLYFSAGNEILSAVREKDFDGWYEASGEVLKELFGTENIEELCNIDEVLAYWTVYFEPELAEEDMAWECGLVPFRFDGTFYLALGCRGMDLSPKLDAYQALTDGTVNPGSTLVNDPEYAKHVVGDEIHERAIKAVLRKKPEHVLSYS